MKVKINKFGGFEVTEKGVVTIMTKEEYLEVVKKYEQTFSC